MTHVNKAFFGVILLIGIFSMSVFADDKIKAEEFVDEASAKGLAEIESAKLALNKSSSQAVRKFAETMIADHTKANQELAAIARNKKLDVAEEPELMSKAKAMILKLREGESFDEAYANNQVMAHEQTIELFQKGASSKNAEIKAFAQKTLPKLEMHLKMARELQAKTQKNQKKVYENGATETDAAKSPENNNRNNQPTN